MAFGPNIAKALLTLQTQAPQIVKNKEADAVKFKYDYADLPGIFAVFKPLLTELGILIMQPTSTHVVDGVSYVGVSTQLVHIESMEDVCTPVLSVKASDPQDLGKVITYLRRYQFNALLGIAPADEDDDCVKIIQPAPRVEAELTGKLKEIKQLIEATNTEVASVRNHYKVKFLDELNDQQMDDCIELLKVRLSRKKAA
jgi:hypothetical protein